MTQYQSEKLKVLSFVAIILVLYIHSGFHDTPNEIQGMAINHYLQESISGMLGRCAVPLFYAISGYLFFLNTENGIIAIFRKMKKRVKTLLVPFVIAALFFPAFYLLMEIFPFTNHFINGSTAFSQNLQQPIGEILCSLFWHTPGGSTPWAFHLWFLRDLIVIVAISPLLYFVKKIIGSGLLVLILFIASFFQIEILPVYALLWFMAGDAFLMKLDKANTYWIPVVFIVLCIAEFVIPGLPWNQIQIPIIALGILSIWNLYDKIVPASFELKKHKWLYLSCSFTFFIYLFHEPTLNIIRKLLILPLGRSSWGFAINYLVSPWVFAGIFIFVGYYLKKYLPRIYAICVGGR